MNDKNKNQPLSLVIGNCFGRYAKYIIQDRALPDIRDGLKPVQRRILFSMNNLGLLSNKPYKKSARTVGEVIGKYHPHGDSSIYEAMIRMSQNWKNNLPLLDVHGNNGSIDGDNPAAMRYTEARLSEVANTMLDNIEKNIVDFALNFDDSEKEPVVLPSLLPNLLINGAMGIAAGYATNIPPHNPKEVFDAIIYRIKNEKTTLDEIIKIIPGPDFPTGGIIQGIDGIRESFLTGKGKFIISSKISFLTNNPKYNQIVISEIPYDTNKSIIIKELSDIMYSDKISGILDVRDETDKNGISIVVDIKKDKDLEQIKKYFLKNTHLQVFYSTNFVTIANKKPILSPLLNTIDLYINFAIEIIVKTAKYDLEKSLNKVEIIQGLVKAIDIIDEIIKIIRSSESKSNAKENLINKFNFTDIQSEAIVNLRLYRLTKTDINELNKELEELNQVITYLNDLINSKTIQKKYLIKKLELFKKKYGYPRKTLIQSEIEKIEIDEASMIEIKENIITVSYDGYIKIFTKKILDSNKIEEIGIRQFDNFVLFKKVLSTDVLVMITKLGKTIAIPIYKINNSKWKDFGQHINEFITLESNDKIIFAKTYTNISEKINLVVLTNTGIIKQTNLLDALNSKQLKASYITKLKNNEYIARIADVINNNNWIISLITNKVNGYSFDLSEVPILNKSAQGVKSIKLNDNEETIGFVLTKTLNQNAFIVSNKGIKEIKLEDFKLKKRMQSPIVLMNTKEQIKQIFIANKLDTINVSYQDKFILRQLNEFNLSCSLKSFNNLKNESNIISIFVNELYSFPIIENINKQRDK